MIARSSLRRRSKKKTLISLTPLIDVVFILLIFFMLASRFSQDHVVRIQLSEVSSVPDQISQRPPQTTVILLDSDGGYHLNQTSYSKIRLEDYVSQNPDLFYDLRLGEGVSYQHMIEVLDIMASQGVTAYRLNEF